MKYNSQDNGPYAVYVYDMNREKPTHPTVISNIIAKAGIPDIQEIKKIGKGKILIELRTALVANRLVDNLIFSKHNLKAFIPAFRVLRVGVIQDVPIEIDLENVFKHIEVPRCKILDIQRLNRRTFIETAKLNTYLQRRCVSSLQARYCHRMCFCLKLDMRCILLFRSLAFALLATELDTSQKCARFNRDAFIAEATDMKQKTPALTLVRRRILNASTVKVIT